MNIDLKVNGTALGHTGKSSIILLIIFASSMAHALTIDFAGYPDGTAASASNPYAGILNIQAQGSYNVYSATDPTFVMKIYQEATVVGGLLDLQSGFAPPAGFVPIEGTYNTTFIATFLRPVTQVSLTMLPLYEVRLGYQGIGPDGLPFVGGEDVYSEPPEGTFRIINIPIPAGGYLTGFGFGATDNTPLLTQVSVESISFAPVPETATACVNVALLAVLALHRIAGLRKRSALGV